MKSELAATTLGEICAKQGGSIQTGPFGSQLHTSDYLPQGIPVVMPTNILEGSISEAGIARVGNKDVERLSQHKLRVGDIVFSRRGDVTKSALITAREVGWLCGTGCLKVRLGDEKTASAEFISYCLQLPEAKDWLVRHAVGVTMPNLNTGILAAVPVRLPPLKAQHRVVAVLRALHHSARHFLQESHTLEQLARTVFRSWFVEFTPTRAKVAGLRVEDLPIELAAAFPSTFEGEGDEAVPRGWRKGALSEVTALNPESWTAKNRPARIKYIDLTGIKANVLLSVDEIDFEAAPSRARRVLRRGDSIYGTVRPGNLSYGYISENIDALTGSTGFAVLRPNAPEYAEFVYCAMTLLENVDRLTHLADGAAYPAVRPNIVHEQELVLPPPELVATFHRVTAPLFESIGVNTRLVQACNALREYLLPRLLSGALAPEEADAAVGELLPA